MTLISPSQFPTRAQLAASSVSTGLAFANSGVIVENNGPNRSAILDKYESVWGMQGVSYCELGHWIDRLKPLCGVLFPGQDINVPLLRRARTLHEQQYGPCPLSCTETIEVYTPRKRWRPLALPQVQTWIAQLRPGDGVIYDFSTPGNFDRHFETFVTMQTDASGHWLKNLNGDFVMTCVGWNTVPDNSGGSQSNGQGCYIRHRAINATVMGSLDQNSEKP